MCGNSHYSMKGIIEVVTQAEFDEWMAKQKAAYYGAFPEKDPTNAPPIVKDTTQATVSQIVKPVSKKG